MSDHSDTALKAFIKLARAHAGVMGLVAEEVPLPPILQGSGFTILEVLFHKGPLSQCEIGRKILKTTGNISQALDKLEKAGLVVRKPGPDRRTHQIELTTAGQTLIAEYFPKTAAAIDKAFSALTEPERAQLEALLKKLGQSLV